MNNLKFQIIKSSDLAHVELSINDLIDRGWRIN